jgi:hypothetical protein
MKIRELFVADVTRDIPPVVYFHEQSPAKLQSEVAEYIVTGGYPEGDPRARRVKSGIHEQFVALLRGIVHERGKAGGPALPASWISGFYGSGKSSFAKLLGLALNGEMLPDGQPLADALLLRDDSPRRQELVDAWKALTAGIESMAVVFDIGGVARDGEHVHSAAVRQLQTRLGYCPKSNQVADFELKLERDGEWVAFLEAAKRTLKKDWAVASHEEQADDHFSHVLHVLKPDRYPEPGTWIEQRAGSKSAAGSSASEAVQSIDAMIHLRGGDKALFIVVDEVSQYIHQDENRMLKLQSFVSELGQRLKGRVWLLATGQQKLEDQAESNNIGKLKDRFPPSLRVHLATTNIRDVVHKRLLKKRADRESILRDLFTKHRGDLKLYGYGCEDITENDFVEVYPMLPGQVDLLMQITSNLRSRSTRVQGDDHAIRGLLQLLGELFREQKLADGEVGALVTLDSIFEVQQSALDADVQTTLARIFDDPRVRGEELTMRAAKAVALLELIQEQTPTTPELVARCLYACLGEGNQVKPVTEALEKLRSLSLVAYSEKSGFKIQSSAGQEWQRDRDNIGVTPEQVSKTVQEALKKLVGSLQERPKWKGRSFPWALWFSDGRQAIDVKLQDVREDSTVAVDFRYLGNKEDRASSIWVPRSDQDLLKNRIVWIVGDMGRVDEAARQLARSERMVERNRNVRETLPAAKQRLLSEEEGRADDLAKSVEIAVAEAFFDGAVYFRGAQLRPRDFGGTFGIALTDLASRRLPELYPQFSDIAISPSELAQLLEPELAGPSTKFMEGQLGILALDAGKYVATCSGPLPQRILAEIERNGGLSGQTLLTTFVAPPYGYAADLTRACCAGLLRGRKIRIQTEKGDDVGSYKDPGARDLFTRDKDFRKATFLLAATGAITVRDRIAIRKLFETYLQVNLETEDEAIADAVISSFPTQRERLRTLERRFDALPGRPPLPGALDKLAKALDDCTRSRLVDKTVSEVKRHLDLLRDGFEQLGALSTDLTPEAIDQVKAAANVRDHELAQLKEMGELSGLEGDDEALRAHLAGDRPWRDIGGVTASTARLHERYVDVRRRLLNAQNVKTEAARTSVKLRPGFAQLDADQAHRVLSAIAAATVQTTADAIAPTLQIVRDRFEAQIHPCEEDANHLLDAELSKLTSTQVVPLDLRLRGREIGTRDELRLMLRDIEEQVGAKVDAGMRVRIT